MPAGLELTEQGEILFHETRDINRRIEFVTARLTDTKDSPSGELRITASVAFGSTWLTPRISEFIEMYPEINMTMLVSDFEIDLSQRTADVAIRLGPLTQPNLIARRILTIRNHIYASKDYLARHGTPMSIDDIEHHELITYGATAPTPIQHINWLENMHIKARRNGATLKINNLYGMLLAVEAGCGIAALPDYMTDGRPNVVRILTRSRRAVDRRPFRVSGRAAQHEENHGFPGLSARQSSGKRVRSGNLSAPNQIEPTQYDSNRPDLAGRALLTARHCPSRSRNGAICAAQNYDRFSHPSIISR